MLIPETCSYGAPKLKKNRRTFEMNCKMLNERKSIRLFYFITKFYNEYFDEYM